MLLEIFGRKCVEFIISLFVRGLTAFAVLCSGLLVAVTPISAQQPALIANIEGRQTTSLDGNWRRLSTLMKPGITITVLNQVRMVSSRREAKDQKRSD